ncbi:MAG: hypothetical protein KatS3mg077_1651 [Candidatus Binatia bacterium]|nr:MAG: hypothetical protein KatS3mg077_1651 [Candidatus Binatia bacterium]
MGDAVWRRVGIGIGVIAVAAFAGSPVHAVELSGKERSFRSFIVDPVTVDAGRFRLEVQGFKIQDDEGARINLIGFRIPKPPQVRRQEIESDGGVFNLIGSYGLSNNSEIGFLLPGYIETRTVAGQKQTKEDMGDVQLYGKFVQPYGDLIKWTAGVQVSLPSGAKNKEFGTDEVGLNPFVGGRLTWKRIGFGGQIGYEFFSGDVPDVFNNSWTLFLKGSDFYTLRGETVIRVFHQGGFRNVDLTVWPGVDLHFSDRLLVRPTGMVGRLASPEWGIGLGLTYLL